MQPVRQGDIEKTIVATGKLEPKRYVNVGAQVSGQVKKIYVEEGDVVKEGQLLVEIDATVFETQVQKAEAALESKKAQLTQLKAERELALLRAKRNEELNQQDAVSQDVVISSQTDVKVLESKIIASTAEIKADAASLAGDKATLGFARIYAPIDGTVASIAVREGQTLNANQNAPELMQISDFTTMTLRAEVSEADVDDISRGMPVYFSTLGNTEKRYQSTVRQVLPTPNVVNDVVLYQVLVDIANPNGTLMDSMTTQVFFVQASKSNTLIVPVAAVKRRGPEQIVMTQKGNALQPLPVTTGVRNRTEIEIIEGLKEGDSVVVGLKEGAEMPNSNRGSTFGGAMPRGPRGI
ncbi:efflux RND transporter periplasmic adaptor subunit [Alteromonas pelagimontana]|uniref:Efflux RND transporter periplasmic adaptor subunit n=2 Tax=Alteromonas pelagimontana TaxID=1858656 RepID=A0A6M4MIL5_9ALTE|nr:efflux RND transporter periplasmic adaptor subunit [Alteromonas pelagimontana]